VDYNARQQQQVEIPVLTKNLLASVADPGCLSRIPDPTFSIPDPNCLHPGSRIRIKEFKNFNPKKTKNKMVSKL
jgi:hypothetical protein